MRQLTLIEIKYFHILTSLFVNNKALPFCLTFTQIIKKYQYLKNDARTLRPLGT